MLQKLDEIDRLKSLTALPGSLDGVRRPRLSHIFDFLSFAHLPY